MSEGMKEAAKTVIVATVTSLCMVIAKVASNAFENLLTGKK